jgi:probable selenate reductase FAD-binding subunit
MQRPGLETLAHGTGSPYNRGMIVDIVRPKSLKEAVRAKEEPGAAYLGGGTWLNACRCDEKTVLVSLENLGLDRIDVSDMGCSIGATVTLQRIVDCADAPQGLREAARLTTSRTLRNMITIGGELGLAPDDSAIIPVLIALKAQVSLAGRKKPVPIDAFLKDRGNALILSVIVPSPSRACVVRVVSRTSHSSRSLVVAAAADIPVRTPLSARIVVSDCRGGRVQLREAGAADGALPEKSRIEESVRTRFAPAADPHASADYKRYMAGVLVADALYALWGG